MLQVNKYYNYILLDPRKPHKWNYDKYTFDYLPFYVGKGSSNRVKNHYFDSSKDNFHKYNVIQKLYLYHITIKSDWNNIKNKK